MPNDGNKFIVQLYFTQSKDSNNKWKCKCGKEIIQKKNTGWTNLFNHIKSQHPESTERERHLKPTSSIDHYVKTNDASKKGKNIFNWIDWICCGLKPFNFEECELTRKYTNLPPVSENTLKKYMDLLTKEVEKKIGDLLPPKFAIVLDGWTKNSTHFLGVFASYTCISPTSKCSNGYETVLLAFSPFLSETEFTASAHYDLLEFVLSIYGKSFENVIAICGDNAEVNKALANLCNLPLVGCASHRFNIAVMNFLKPYKELLDKINTLMGKLKNLKLSGLLRNFTSLRPVQKNVTRWSSVAEMLDRYERLKTYLADPAFTSEATLIDFFPTARENAEISQIHEHLKKLKSITLTLQKENINLTDVRYLFDEVINLYSNMKDTLGEEAKIVHSPTFEKALVKIQDEKLNEITAAEERAVMNLRLSTDNGEEIPTASESDASDDFATTLLLKKRKLDRNARYMNTTFILPTSNIAERFFSCATYALNDLRQSLSPTNLEMQLFLKINRRLWDEKLVSQIVGEN